MEGIGSAATEGIGGVAVEGISGAAAEGISGAPNWPNLAGQHQEYLIEAITQYQRGDRTDAVMAGQVQALTPEDVAAIAAFYASQPGLLTVAY